MNTETKHTPGPWHIASVVLPKLDSHTALAVWDEAHQVLPDSINGRPICILTPIDKRNPIDEANAALIASAPDMAKELAQLKADNASLIEGLKECRKAMCLDTNEEVDADRLAEALIAKHSKV